MTREETTEWLTFDLATEVFALNLEKVREVMETSMSDISHAPGAPHYTLGITKIRDEIVGVVDACRLFSIGGHKTPEDAKIIVLDDGETCVGLLVDGVTEVVRLNRKDIEIPPQTGHADEKYIQGVCRLKEQLIILLNVTEILNGIEQ